MNATCQQLWTFSGIKAPNPRLLTPGSRPPQLIPEPGVLAFRVAPRRDENRVSQRTLGQLPVHHRHDLPISDAIESRRVRGDAGVKLALHFSHKSRREHVIDTGCEPPVQDLTRHGEVNVPGPERSALTGLPLPPRQRMSRQQRDLDRARGTLPAAAEKRRIEPSRPPREVGALERFRPAAELLTPLRIERRLTKQSFSEGADVQPRPAHDDRLAAGNSRFRNPARGIAGEPSCAVTLSGSHQIQAAMRDPGLRRAIGLGRADVEAAIHLAGVGGDHRDGSEGGERNRDGSFADAGGAYENGCRGW